VTLIELGRSSQLTEREKKTGDRANDHDPQAIDNRVPKMTEIEAGSNGFRLRI
jgi:hypothetical protein